MNDTINLPVPPFKILERTLTALTRRRALRTFVQRLPLGWIGALDPLVSVAQRPEAKRWQKTTRPPRNDHISHPAKKQTHLQKCLGWDMLVPKRLFRILRIPSGFLLFQLWAEELFQVSGSIVLVQSKLAHISGKHLSQSWVHGTHIELSLMCRSIW